MRNLKLVLVLAALVAAIGTPARAQGVAILYLAPHTETLGAVSGVALPCTINDSLAPATSTDPSAGTLAPLAIGINVSGCSIHGRTEYRSWRLGEVLAPLVGRPATVVAVFDGVGEASVSGTGSLSATVSVKLGDAELPGRYATITSARCQGGGCSSLRSEGLRVFAQALDALPSTLYAILKTETSATNATGHAEAVYRGRLVSVVVEPRG